MSPIPPRTNPPHPNSPALSTASFEPLRGTQPAGGGGPAGRSCHRAPDPCRRHLSIHLHGRARQRLQRSRPSGIQGVGRKARQGQMTGNFFANTATVTMSVTSTNNAKSSRAGQRGQPGGKPDRRAGVLPNRRLQEKVITEGAQRSQRRGAGRRNGRQPRRELPVRCQRAGWRRPDRLHRHDDP